MNVVLVFSGCLFCQAPFLFFFSGFPGGLDDKEICLQGRRSRFDSWVRKIPWRRERQPTPVSLPGESHGQRSLGGYSPWHRQESDMTEQLTLSFFWLKVNQFHWSSQRIISEVHLFSLLIFCFNFIDFHSDLYYFLFHATLDLLWSSFSSLLK